MHVLSSSEHSIAAALQQATRTRHAAGNPVAQIDGIRVLEILKHLAIERGWQPGVAPKFWKSGGAYPGAELFHAPLAEQNVFQCSSAQAVVQLAQKACTLYGIEAEIAFRVGCDIDVQQAAALHQDELAQVIDGMTVAIEWVDSRWTQHLQSPKELLQADSLSHGALVLGPTWLSYADKDWLTQICTINIDSTPLRPFKGSHPLNNPTNVLVPWIQHATRYWGVLRAGSVVTSGSWTGIVLAQAQSHVQISFNEIGSAQLKFGMPQKTV